MVAYLFCKARYSDDNGQPRVDRELPVGLDTLEIIMGCDGLPEAFRIPDEGRPFERVPASPFERFGELLEENFEPLVVGWSRQVKLSGKVLWNNAANYIEWLVGALTQMGVPSACLEDGRRLIESEYRPDGKRNPMYRPVRYIPVTWALSVTAASTMLYTVPLARVGAV